MIEPDQFKNSEAVSGEEENFERALRPKELVDYVGQEKIREQLEIFIGAAKKRKEPLDHLLLFGPPGLGKTTLAHIIANEMGVNLKQTSGPVLERSGDLAAILTKLEPFDILFRSYKKKIFINTFFIIILWIIDFKFSFPWKFQILTFNKVVFI